MGSYFGGMFAEDPRYVQTPPSPFAHGPYTDPETDSSADAPTLDRRTQRRNIKTAVIIALFLIVVGCVIGVAGAKGAHVNDEPRESLPVCEYADGHTQKACVFQSSHGPVVNLDYGRYAYDKTNNMTYDFGTDRK